MYIKYTTKFKKCLKREYKSPRHILNRTNSCEKLKNGKAIAKALKLIIHRTNELIIRKTDERVARIKRKTHTHKSNQQAYVL